MSSTEKPDSDQPFPSSTAHQYFQAIETAFIALRGAPLLLAPDDWQIARDWHRQGIPLRLVEQTLADIFERRRARDGKAGRRTLVTLRYCRRAVERAWHRRQEMLAPAASETSAPRLDPQPRLEALAAALPEDLSDRQDFQVRILGLHGDAEEVERQLVTLDSELVTLALDALPSEQRAELDSRLRTALRPLAERLPQAELARAGSLLQEQLLRRLVRLPVLSLFSPEAEP